MNRFEKEFDLMTIFHNIRDANDILKHLVSKKDKALLGISKERIIDLRNDDQELSNELHYRHGHDYEAVSSDLYLSDCCEKVNTY